MDRNDIIILFYTFLVLLFFVSAGLRGQFSVYEPLEPFIPESFVRFFSSTYYILILLGFSAVLPEGETIKGCLYRFARLLAPIAAIISAAVCFDKGDVLTGTLALIAGVSQIVVLVWDYRRKK